MSELLSTTRIEDAIDQTQHFMNAERGALIDGGFASETIQQSVLSSKEVAAQLLQSNAIPSAPGLYVALSNKNHNQFNEAVAALPGHFVLIAAKSIGDSHNGLYPAVISPDSTALTGLRLHVLRQPYRQALSPGARTILSGAAQAETKGIGDHSRATSDSVEAEHFTALLASAGDAGLQAHWSNGSHINHSWRSAANTSVTTEMHRNIFADTLPQTSITVSRQDIETGRQAIFWHEGLMQEHGAESATTNNALVVVQALGFQAVQQSQPGAIDTIKRLIS